MGRETSPRKEKKMHTLQLSKEIKGASKMVASELKTVLIKELNRFKFFTDEEIENEIEASLISVDGNTVKVWFDEFEF